MANILVVAPHPDDEVLGVGGTILKHVALGNEVHVLICTRGEIARFGKEQVERVSREAKQVHEFMGIAGSHWLDLPAARLDTVPGTELNVAIGDVMSRVVPEVVFAPHPGDVHRDHQLVFQSVMVCARPVGSFYPKRIYAYETVSETDWYAAPVTPAFTPNVFVDIGDFIDSKIEACSMYESQIRPSPDQRSTEAIRALAVTRGHSMGMRSAEAFMLVRELIS